MNKVVQILLIVVGMGALLMIIGAVYFVAFGEDAAVPLTASINEITGQVQSRLNAEGEWAVAQDGQFLDVGGQVTTGPDGRARMDLSSGTIIRISNNAFLSLEELQQTDNGPITKIKVGFGQVWVILRGGSLEANTPSGVASVRGSYMSVNVDTETGEAFVTCLEGDCVMQTASGEMAMSAGQTAQVTNINSLPVPGHMTDEMVQEWLAFNPEATVVMMAVTATVRASRPDVALPDLACIADNSCVAYCTPPGYDPSSGALPGLDQFPPDCIDLAYTLLWQGVDPERFMTCFMLGGDMQTCANDAVRVVVPSSPSTGAPVVTLPDLACIATNDCSTFCMPSGWDPSSGETPPVEAIPPACVAAAESMYAQGVDPWLFIQCVVTYNEPQGCADAAVR